MMRVLLALLAGICACNAAAIEGRDETVLLNAILNASHNKSVQSNSLEKATWTRLKPKFLHEVQKESSENTGGKHTPNQVAAVLQNSLSRDKDEWFGEKENLKNLSLSDTLIETPMTKNEDQNNSANDSFNISKNENDIVRKDMDIWKASVISNESFSENILKPLEMNKSNIFALNFTDYATDIQVFYEDLNSMESLNVDENNLMSEGSEIALFQELPITGFEFLIDSETTRNLILTQLFTSQSLLMDEFGDLEESTDFDPLPTKLNLDENIEINVTQEIFNLTKDWYKLSEAADGENYIFNLNVTDDAKSGWITNVEFTDLFEESSFSHSETTSVSFDGNAEAEFNRNLQVKAVFTELKDSDTLPEVGSESNDFIYTSDFEYDGPIKSHIDLRNFTEELFVPITSLFNLTKNTEFDIAAQGPEPFNLVNNSQGFFERENVASETFNFNATNAIGDIIKSNNFENMNESLASIFITRQAGVNENINEELNIKEPMQESFNRIDFDTLITADEKATEKFQSNITDFDYDWTSSKMDVTNFEESVNSSLETVQFTHSLNENGKTKLNITQEQEIFSLTNNSDTLSEETKTKFLSNSSNYANESNRIGEFLGLVEESQDFIANTQSFKLGKTSEATLSMMVPFEETLNMTNNSNALHEIDVTDFFNVNTTDISNIITELEEFTDLEAYLAATTENYSFNLDENSDSELNMTSMPQTSDMEDFGVFFQQNDTERFSLNITGFLHNRTTESMKDAMAKTQRCPASGICLLWFFARNSCTEDSQCHNTQKCCMSGCSKICMDV